ncbi:hypothetical protein CZ771_12855 [Actinomycetales bacterium JB111]|nr:hypothetical protein CZ771_12855 [Actinomycetales bacterium JB111]
MSDVEITVRGSSLRRHPAQRGTVHAYVSVEGPESGEVFDAVAQSVEQVQASVGALHDPEAGPVTRWFGQEVRTWAARPWNDEGKQLPFVHHARADLEVEFSNFGVLSTWLRDMAELHGFAVDRVEWSLTEERRAELEHEARVGGVESAREKAAAFAGALGYADVRALEVADAGMLSGHRQSEGGDGVMFARAAAFSDAGRGELRLVPEDIEIAVKVDARFVAREA